MGRPPKFGRDQILDGALAIVAEDGPGAATMAAIAARLGAPTGSLYHRFGSRDLLIAALWLRGVHRFQDGFVAALAAGDPYAAALHTPRWCRDHPAEAAVLLLHRREDLTARWPAELGAEVAGADTRVRAALDAFAAERPGLDRERLVFALVDVPYGAVRRHLLARRPPPPLVDDLVLATCQAVLPPP
ncbi:putative transcriptional regulator, TetR family protein [Sphaerisporangium siamense]|uniref:AcrR family transcriptional regulator n=1 Tax=Sphaerisporangium siamense TaxID=795645 RepID=A0A7W7DDH1_9ACTN|nr:TetR/AcrR family transcriptional regulator [Sphaerisporangium siamense]MBB4704539.1 AcrR family transcriptional regulator [Sphaerisporangium siamense]GII86151.1 putative transcriptional regulator, TetR family protein [Sphaerisporangium siamense]